MASWRSDALGTRRDNPNGGSLGLDPKLLDDRPPFLIAEGGKGFGELRGCQNAEGMAKMIPIDLRSWIATQERP